MSEIEALAWLDSSDNPFAQKIRKKLKLICSRNWNKKNQEILFYRYFKASLPGAIDDGWRCFFKMMSCSRLLKLVENDILDDEKSIDLAIYSLSYIFKEINFNQKDISKIHNFLDKYRVN
ncbi:MAG: hypothetical protein ABJN57_06360 [Hyphomicrobiales bacterium]